MNRISGYGIVSTFNKTFLHLLFILNFNMNTLNSSGISVCGFCQYYTPEGIRGGSCSILQASVSGNWQACSVGVPFFQNPPPDQELVLGKRKPFAINVLIKKAGVKSYAVMCSK
jgi:hypothetical protein